MEVLDVNGLQRQVAIFPESVPYVVDDLRAAHVEFFVAPAVSHTDDQLLLAFVRAFIATLLVIMVMDAFGMLGYVAFALAMMPQLWEAWGTAVLLGWERTLDEWKGKGQQQSEAIPVRIDEDKECKDEEDYSTTEF